MENENKIYKFEIENVPEVLFSHMHVTNDYKVDFSKCENMLEISYFEHSSAILKKENGEKIFIPSNSVFVNLYDQPAGISSSEYQVHYTVGFRVKYKETEKEGDNVVCFKQLITDEDFVKEVSEIIKLCTKKILNPNRSKFELSALVLQLFAKYQKYKNTTSERHQISPIAIKYVEQAQEYISNHIKEGFTVANVANHLGISSGYLSNLFQKVTGTSIVQYANRIRLEIAKNLVCNESATLAEACAVSGISDPNYLSRMFRKYMDTTITDIKNNIKSPR